MPVTSSPAAAIETSPRSTGNRLERADLVALLLLCGAVFVLSGLYGAVHPFWFDEIATAHIAGSPTWQEMLRRSQTVDLHPPLEFLLVRLSFHLFGPHEFAGHLPSVLSYTVGVGCLFLFLRRRLSLLYALFGALLPLVNSDIFHSVTEARPYGLLFGGAALALLAYDTVLRGNRPVAARVLLAVSLLAILQAHLFGTLVAFAFVLAEAVRTVRRRQLDTLTWAALLLPWVSCVTYVPLLRIQAAGHGSPMMYEEANRTSLRKGLLFFHQTLYLPIAPLIKIVAVVLICLRFFPTRRFLAYFAAPPELLAALGWLLAMPVLVTLLLHVRAPASGFFPRYAIVAACPFVLLLTGLIAWRAGESRRAGFVFLAVALAGAAVTFADTPAELRTVAHNGLFGAPPHLAETHGVEAICPQLPLAMNDALNFLEADFRLPADAELRLVYPSDAAQSRRLEHEDATQAVAGMSRAFETPHHVVPGMPFLAAHPDFLLLTHPGHKGWLEDWLHEEHAREQPLGRFLFAGTQTQLWLVTQPVAGPFPATAGCPAH